MNISFHFPKFSFKSLSSLGIFLVFFITFFCLPLAVSHANGHNNLTPQHGYEYPYHVKDEKPISSNCSICPDHSIEATFHTTENIIPQIEKSLEMPFYIFDDSFQDSYKGKPKYQRAPPLLAKSHIVQLSSVRKKE